MCHFRHSDAVARNRKWAAAWADAEVQAVASMTAAMPSCPLTDEVVDSIEMKDDQCVVKLEPRVAECICLGEQLQA